ncbi:MAG: TIGR03936 family radical SAM-associated protein [Gordonibacter sp.]|nr:TIGR03936 family radical SAM-associated protein [Gordonibacter sp.]
MPDPRNFRLRVTFCKQGRLALLSHLEVARALERAVRRAGLPFAISQGFSPHMKIAFGAALPVGVGGLRESFDLQLTRYVSPEQALDALQAASAPDLMVKSCQYIEAGAPAASVAYPISTYRALLSCAPSVLPLPNEIVVVRKKKEKVLQVPDFIVGDVELTGSVITFSLEAKPTGSLRPDVLLNASIEAYNAAKSNTFGTDVTLIETSSGLSSDNNASPCYSQEELRVVSVTRIDQRHR